MKIGKITEKEVTVTMTHIQANLIRNCLGAIKMGPILQSITFSKRDIKPAEDIIASIDELKKKIKATKTAGK